MPDVGPLFVAFEGSQASERESSGEAQARNAAPEGLEGSSALGPSECKHKEACQRLLRPSISTAERWSSTELEDTRWSPSKVSAACRHLIVGIQFCSLSPCDFGLLSVAFGCDGPVRLFCRFLHLHGIRQMQQDRHCRI